MTSRSKEKMAAALRKMFRSSQKIGDPEGAVGGQSSSSSAGGSESPARRLLRGHGHGYAVTPAPDIEAPASSPSAGGGNRRSVAELFKPKKERPEKQQQQQQQQPRQEEQSAAASHQKMVRTRRLMKELRDIQRVQSQQHCELPVFTAELVNDNLFEWHVRLFRVDAESDLATDMRNMGVPYILLHLAFPENFPFAPPFMRVVSPRIEKGFVMEGGAICMELLTPRGWASAYTVEAIVMQFAASIVKGQGRIAKKHKGSKDFNRRSAEESFRSLVKTHEKYGWVTPPLADG